MITTKAERTRARILEVALELFGRQGYEATTVGQIAAASDITEMTFYRHFGSKAQLLVDDPYDPLIAAAIAEQPADLLPLARTVAGIRTAWRRLPITEEQPIRERVALVAGSPSLAGAMRAGTLETEAAISAQLVADGADETDAAIAASAAMAALMTGLVRWATAPRQTSGSLAAAVERALDVLEPGGSR